MLRRKNPARRRRSSVDMWTTQGRCPHTHTSSNSDSQRYLFDYFRLDGSGSRHNPQESWADTPSRWLRHLCADSDSHSHADKPALIVDEPRAVPSPLKHLQGTVFDATGHNWRCWWRLFPGPPMDATAGHRRTSSGSGRLNQATTGKLGCGRSWFSDLTEIVNLPGNPPAAAPFSVFGKPLLRRHFLFFRKLPCDAGSAVLSFSMLFGPPSAEWWRFGLQGRCAMVRSAPTGRLDRILRTLC
jgi:hypothetical protein